MSIVDALEGLDNQRKALAANLVAKGVAATETETLAELIPKILQIAVGGGEAPPPLFPVLSSSSNLGPGQPPSMAFDKKGSTYWAPAGATNIGEYILVDFHVPTKPIKTMLIRSETGRLKGFRLDGSNDGNNWTTLFSGDYPNSADLTSFDVSAVVGYRMYRVYITSVPYSYSTPFISELELSAT